MSCIQRLPWNIEKLKAKPIKRHTIHQRLRYHLYDCLITDRQLRKVPLSSAGI